ncbi:MAG: hypothetical protein Q8W46_11550 [Candidatus Palauibacterales bacterium]|nr:hypothetical protein [Candidatus Palauibacterales bacterium]
MANGLRFRNSLLLFVLLTTALADRGVAQIQRNPTGVNVNASGATTVFITFGNLAGKVPVEATWCGELVSAEPDIGFRCDPATIFGSLPIRYDQSRFSGQDGFTDIMSIPPSVARRAYQAAQGGAESSFFYVRQFVDPAGIEPDEYVTVTCRMTGGGARVPFTLLDVSIGFVTDDPVLSLRVGDQLPSFEAHIAYNGTGRLRGRWEIVFPGEELPTNEDLLTEATLPAELRGTQRRFTELERFNVFLPPTGEYTLEGPDPSKIPTHMDGMYLVLLRIEVSDDKEGDSNLGAAGAGTGIVHTGAAAGFPIPPLRYYVGSAGPLGASSEGLALVLPEEDAAAPAGDPLVFTWNPAASVLLYRLEVENEAGELILEAYVQPGIEAYLAPPWLQERATGDLRWRVIALGPGGDRVGETPWRGIRLGAAEAEDS